MLVGGGPYRAEIERQVAAHRLEPHVIFAGRTSERDLHAWYEAANVFVHPTRYEGSSLVTLEAMAHRQPVIATAPAGCPTRSVRASTAGSWSRTTPTALSRAIADAASSPTRLIEHGRESREIVEREFAWRVLVERYVNLYMEILRAKALMMKTLRICNLRLMIHWELKSED